MLSRAWQTGIRKDYRYVVYWARIPSSPYRPNRQDATVEANTTADAENYQLIPLYLQRTAAQAGEYSVAEWAGAGCSETFKETTVPTLSGAGSQPGSELLHMMAHE